jgi:hypothetical protein
MDLSDLSIAPVTRRGPAPPAASDSPAAPALAAQLGAEVAHVLSSAIERLNAFATTGRIDREGLRALRDEIEFARRIGIMAQQVERLASGRVPVAPERFELAALLREALQQRQREVEARGIEVRQTLRPVTVKTDTTLAFSLLQTILDWSFAHARGRIDLTLGTRTWPAHGLLTCSFATTPADEFVSGMMPLEAAAEGVETLPWRLLRQTAQALSLIVERRDHGGRSTLTIEFPCTVGESLESAEDAPDTIAGSLAEANEPGDDADLLNSRPLAGSHVLVLAARRELRGLVREALRPMGLMVDYVSSIDEAREFCRGGMPHAIVYEGALGGERFERLRSELVAEVPRLAFIRIAEQGKAIEVLNVAGRELSSVGRDALMESLPSALMFELARCA